MAEGGYSIPGVSNDSIVQKALDVAAQGVTEINSVLADIQGGTIAGDAANTLGDSGYTHEATGEVVNTGREVLDAYGVTGNVDIESAAGAMVIDDLMQKISTKVQVAAQLLSTANNINKTASRIMSQG
jgi:hypothetical protein